MSAFGQPDVSSDLSCQPHVCASASAKVLRNLAVSQNKTIEPFIRSQMSSLKGSILKFDHTFWGAKFVRQGGEECFTSILTIMNEKSQLLGLYFCTSKSLAEVREELCLVAAR